MDGRKLCVREEEGLRNRQKAGMCMEEGREKNRERDITSSN